jgi:hypothetical protein
LNGNFYLMNAKASSRVTTLVVEDCLHLSREVGAHFNSKECFYYRDRIRQARYAALADAEGFSQICFALESLGLRLFGKEAALGEYRPCIAKLAENSAVLTDLPKKFPSQFKSFAALFEIVRTARNDAMHLGAYARHATVAGVELCIGLEESLMANVDRTVGNLMVASPVVVEQWQPIAHARQLMLMHSFSCLPVRMSDSWWLLSELDMARFLAVVPKTKKERLGCAIKDAMKDGLKLLRVKDEELLKVSMSIRDVLQRPSIQNGPTLWLVGDEKYPEHLAGVLTPFELM